jgi:hypothetical protein
LNAPEAGTSGDEKNDPAAAVDDSLHEGSPSP